ncbi:hypothetical protein ACSTHG_23340, partial [Vibrio parahaemolyticus]
LSVCGTYDAAQLAAVFSSTTVTVANPGTPDTVAPDLGAGQLLTTRFSRAQCAVCTLRAEFAVGDQMSGVFTAALSIAAPNGVVFGGT